MIGSSSPPLLVKVKETKFPVIFSAPSIADNISLESYWRIVLYFFYIYKIKKYIWKNLIITFSSGLSLSKTPKGIEALGGSTASTSEVSAIYVSSIYSFFYSSAVGNYSYCTSYYYFYSSLSGSASLSFN